MHRLIFLTVYAVILSFSSSLAQNPFVKVDRIPSSYYCLGTELALDVTVVGEFPENNTFEIVAIHNFERRTFDAQIKGHQIITRITDPYFANGEDINLRLVTTNPRHEVLIDQPIKIMAPSMITLSGRNHSQSDTLNATDTFALYFHHSSPTQTKVFLNSGDSIQINYQNARTYPYSKLNVDLPKNFTYQIVKVQNECNNASFKGELNIQLNPTEIRITGLKTRQLCEEDSLEINFQAANTDVLTENTKYTIRLGSQNNYSPEYTYIDLPAVLVSPNTLRGKIPTGTAQLFAENKSEISVGIVTTHPHIVALDQSINRIAIGQQPSFHLEATSDGLADEVTIRTNPVGVGPITFIFESGEVIGQQSSFRQTEASKTYKVKRIESGCGIINNPVHTPLVVHLKPSLYLQANDTTVCTGQTIRLPFKAIGITNYTTFKADFEITPNKNVLLQARKIGDYIEIEIPKGILDFDLYQSSLRIVSENPILYSNRVNVKLQDIPKIQLRLENSTTTLASPDIATLHYQLVGRGPYEVQWMNGEKTTHLENEIQYKTFITSSVDYRIRHIANACYSNSSLPSNQITVQDSNDPKPAIFMELVNEKMFCRSDSLEFYVELYGKFNEGNQFRLSYIVNGTFDEITLLTLNKSGYYKVKPTLRWEGPFTVTFYLKSTSPALETISKRIAIHDRPGHLSPVPLGNHIYPVYTSPNYLTQLFIEPNQANEIHYTMNDQSHVVKMGQDRLQINVPHTPGDTSHFVFHSSRNECGTTHYTPSPQAYFYSPRYKISLNNLPYHQCVGNKVEFLFTIYEGSALPTTTYTLQRRLALGGRDYVDVATTNTQGILSYTFPQMDYVEYAYRIKSSDNIVSDEIRILVNKLPDVQITTPNEVPIVRVGYGDPFALVVINKGGPIQGIVYSDSTILKGENAIYYSLTATTSQDFTVNRVWNECGYGKTKDYVKVIVTPNIVLSKVNEEKGDFVCPDEDIELTYSIEGGSVSLTSEIIFSLSSPNKSPIMLASSKQGAGRIRLKLPTSIQSEHFDIIAEHKESGMYAKQSYTQYKAPSFTLLGGYTITEGQPVNLLIKVNTPFQRNRPLFFSDGSSVILTRNEEGAINQVPLLHSPTSTTTFELAPIHDVCGNIGVDGKATIVVEPRKKELIQFQRMQPINRTYACNGMNALLYFEELGLTSSHNEYEVDLIDTFNEKAWPLSTQGTNSPITVTIPAEIKHLPYYRFRIRPKNTAISGSTSAELYEIMEQATAYIETPIIELKYNQDPTVEITFKGSPPYYYEFEANGRYLSSGQTLAPQAKVTVPIYNQYTLFTLVQVANQCGFGSILSSPHVEVSTVTGIDQESDASISFGPNPTEDVINFTFPTTNERTLELVSTKDGMILQQKKITSQKADFQLANYPSGIYLLRVIEDRETKVYKIVKH